MRLFDRLAQLFGEGVPNAPDCQEPTAVNPATGLPTVGGVGTPDIMGNPFGTDLHRRHDDGSRHDRWDAGPPPDDGTRWHDPWPFGGAGGGHDPWRD